MIDLSAGFHVSELNSLGQDGYRGTPNISVFFITDSSCVVQSTLFG